MAGKIVNRRLYNAIERYAKKRGMSYPRAIKSLADCSGYRDHTKIYSFIRGDMHPGFERACKIAKALGKTVDYLFGEV